jgi:pimeloyl-ACP methyl ester carboxylesterase
MASCLTVEKVKPARAEAGGNEEMLEAGTCSHRGRSASTRRTDDRIRVDVQFHHGEADVVAPPHRIAEEIPGSYMRLYPDVGHLSIDRHIKDIAVTLIAP